MAYRLLARVAVARGRWSAARAQLDTARRFDPVAELELRSLLAVLPFLQVPRSELLEVRRRGGAWQARLEAPGEPSHSAAHTGLHPVRAALSAGPARRQPGGHHRGAAVRGLTRARRRLGERLEGGCPPHFRAEHSRPRRRRCRPSRPKALEHLERIATGAMVESIFEAEALDRYYRAELLFALGRHAEALDWYRTIAERATYELVYVAPARWRQGWLYEEMGDRARAVEAYRTVARLWRDADPPLRLTVTEASQRLRTLAPDGPAEPAR